MVVMSPNQRVEGSRSGFRKWIKTDDVISPIDTVGCEQEARGIFKSVCTQNQAHREG